jgi:hypothetical protein
MALSNLFPTQEKPSSSAKRQGGSRGCIFILIQIDGRTTMGRKQHGVAGVAQKNGIIHGSKERTIMCIARSCVLGVSPFFATCISPFTNVLFGTLVWCVTSIADR